MLGWLARALGFVARHGRFVVASSLIVGLLLPDLGTFVRPWLPEMIALLLVLAALQIEPRQMLGALHELPHLIGVLIAFQVGMPLAIVSAAWALELLEHPLVLPVVLMASAPAVTASPLIALMVGRNPAVAMRVLILGTAMLPLTILPVFYAMPVLGSTKEVTIAALKLLAVIVTATVASIAFRKWTKEIPKTSLDALEGLAAILFFVAVLGLVSTVRPMITDETSEFAFWMSAAFAANFSAQALAYFAIRKTRLSGAAVELAFIAGNRNMALFFISLPVAIGDRMLPFIGCYQYPMFITPLLLHWILKSRPANSA